MGTYSGPAPGTTEADQRNQPPHQQKKIPPKTRKSRWWFWLLVLGVAAAVGYRFYPQVRAGSAKPEKAEKSAGKRASQAVPAIATPARRGHLPTSLGAPATVADHNRGLIRRR